MTGARCTAQPLAGQVRQVRADSQHIDRFPIELITRQCEVVVTEERGEGLEVVTIGGDGVDGDVALVREIVEKVADLGFHRPSVHPVSNHVSVTPP